MIPCISNLTVSPVRSMTPSEIAGRLGGSTNSIITPSAVEGDGETRYHALALPEDHANIIFVHRVERLD